MAGYREFQTGEVLTAANVDDFLAKQAVMKFADAAARNTALGTAVAGGNALREGMVAYLDDTDELLKYDGTDWLEVGGGGLVAVKSAIFTGTQSASVAGGGNVAITDLSISHETADAANKLIITACIGAAGSSGAVANVGIGVFDGSNFIGVGTTAGSRTSVSAGGFAGAAAFSKVVEVLSTTFVHVPGAGSKTYTVRALSIDTDTRTLSINSMQDDSDNAKSSRAISSLVIQEVSV